MINIYRLGTRVFVSIETGLSTQKAVEFSAECSNDLFAELLSNQILELLDKRIEAIRKTEYLSGRRDSRKKGKKRDYFYFLLDNSKYE